MRPTRRRPRNRLTWGELGGAMGDLGITLPLAFALVTFSGFSPALLFTLWGAVYVVTGWFYKVPISVQPLKAMAVIAIAGGLAPSLIATASVAYGLLFILLAVTGAIQVLHKLFSPALIRGVQVGIGLVLAKKALGLALGARLLLGSEASSLPLALAIGLGAATVIIVSRWRLPGVPLAIPLVVAGILYSQLFLPAPGALSASVGPELTIPDWSLLGSAIVLLIIPQLPLTLGNAVYAANDAAHSFFPGQSRRVTPRRLALTIGLSNLSLGLIGGFPICHGAGGIGAHYRFGGRTGTTTVLLGLLLIVAGTLHPILGLLFLIPLPLLATLLLFDGLTMVGLARDLRRAEEFVPMAAVALLSLWTHNLAWGLAVGWLLERVWGWRTAHSRLFPLVLERSRRHGALRPATPPNSIRPWEGQR